MIFFDLDGTLIDSNAIWTELDETFARRRGLTVTAEYKAVICRVAFPAAADFTKQYYQLPETPEEIMAEWMELAHDAYAHTIPLKPGAADLLEELKQAGRRMAVFTASPPDLCHCCMERHGLTGFFEGFFFSQETGLEKGDPAIYELAAQRFGTTPSRCILLDDSPDNCAAAGAAGLTVVGVYDSFYETRWDEVVRNSDRAVRSLEELRKTGPFPLTAWSGTDWQI